MPSGALPKRRRLVHAVRDRAFLPGPPGIWDSEWVHVPAICAEDIAHWPYIPGLLVKWVSFSGGLHWSAGGLDLGVGGISYVELLILYELWAGERLSLEKAHPRHLWPGRPISVSAVPFGPGIDMWRSCRFIAAVMRSLCWLPGGLGRFVPCSVGADHCRLRHLGLFRYPPGSGRALLAGTLPLSCCARFARTHSSASETNNNNNIIWGRLRFNRRGASTQLWGVEACSLLSSGPTPSQLSRFMSSGHHISMEHRLRRKTVKL